MNQNIVYLIAVFLGVIHILLRRDYYKPFVTIKKLQGWSSNKTLGVVLLSSIGHVLGSVVLSAVGLVPAIMVARLSYFSPMKETILAWFVILFGVFFIVYGIRQAYRSKPHKHLHLGADGTYHTHTHIHKKDSALVEKLTKNKKLSVWSIVVTYTLNPFEALVVIQVWPLMKSHYMMIVVVTCIFSVAVIIAMLTMSYLVIHGKRFGWLKRTGLFSYIIIGALILVYGLVLLFS